MEEIYFSLFLSLSITKTLAIICKTNLKKILKGGKKKPNRLGILGLKE